MLGPPPITKFYRVFGIETEDTDVGSVFTINTFFVARHQVAGLVIRKNTILYRTDRYYWSIKAYFPIAEDYTGEILFMESKTEHWSRGAHKNVYMKVYVHEVLLYPREVVLLYKV